MAFLLLRRIVLLLNSCVHMTYGLRNGLDLVPPLGWSNWESSGCDINETYVKANAQALLDTGLAAAGFSIVEVDDCWAEGKRNASGHLVADHAKFPNGMGELGKWLHARGLKFGMYSSAGVHCCQNTMPGSLGYEWLDAQTFASWGVDFLKYDGCFMEEFAAVEQDAQRRFPFSPPPILRYPIMGQALNHTGRNISYMCNFPWQFWGLESNSAMGGRWVSEVCNSWRTAGDPQPGFTQALGYVRGTEKYADLVPSGPGGWHTLDALEIGNNNSWDQLSASGVAISSSGGSSPGKPLRALRVGGGGMSADQERAAISLYVIIKTPLFIGADATQLSGHSLEVYLNRDLLAIHQDPLGAQGRRVWTRGSIEVWACALSGGRAAAVVVNSAAAGSAVNTTVSWRELPLPAADDPSATRDVYDVWLHASVGAHAEHFEASVPSDSAVVIVVGSPQGF